MFNIDKDQTLLQTSLMDKDKDELTISLVGGNDKKVGSVRNNSIDRSCLTPEKTEYIYKKVELCSLINKDTIKEEID